MGIIMNEVTYTVVSTEDELRQIMDLQKKNLPVSISIPEKEKEGFVTVEHDFKILKKMNDQQPHIIAKDKYVVIGYALCMLQEFRNDIEILKPMFAKIDEELVEVNSYVVMGQICIDKNYRKQGIFRRLYQTMQKELKEKYDVLITEVSAKNLRSLQAHYAIGFTDLLVYETEGTIWHLLQWDWK